MIVVLLVSLFLQDSLAQNIVAGKVVKKIEIKEVPSFFFKVKSDGKYISYSVADPDHPAAPGVCHLLDVNLKTNILIPGPWDPVLIPKTDLLFTPFGSEVMVHMNYGIYDLLKVKLLQTAALPFFQVQNFHGYYQSAGILSESTDGTQKIRLISEGSAIHYVTDLIYRSADRYIEQPSSDEHPLCSNLGRIKLPMISKDGQFLGAYDTQTKTSGIFKIHDDYTCEKVIDLKIKTGKLNFSYDGKKITYHINNESVVTEDDPDFIAIPNASMVADVFVVELATMQVTRITANQVYNSMYPDFTEEGDLVFINHPHDRKKKVSFSFVSLK